MTRFRDAKVCNNWLQMKIDDHRIQSDYKYKSGLQHPVGKTLHLVLRLRGDDTMHDNTSDTNDNVTTKTQSTFCTAHMNIDV